MKIALVYLNNDRLISRGVGYLCQIIRDQSGHSIRLFDTAWIDYSQMLAKLATGGFDLVMISCTSFYWPRAQQLSRFLKSQGVGPIIVGGAHATVLRGEMLRLCPEIDYICVGEGEEFILEFLSYLVSGGYRSTIRNLGYRAKDGTIKINQVRPPTNLATLPPLDHSIFNASAVVSDQTLFSGFTYVFATRGCPYNCSYCCNGSYLDLYGAKRFLRTQSVDTVMAELDQLRTNYPMKLAYFGDEMILFDEDYVTELFTRIHQEMRLPYGCMFRVEALTPEIINLLRKTGCKYAAVGIECGDEQFRREYLNRRGTNLQLIRGVRRLHKIPKIWITTYNMQGYPVSFDDQLSAATKALNKELSPHHAQTTWFRPIYGTPLYDYCVDRGLIDWALHDKSEDYFRRSVIRRPIAPELDKPIYPDN